MTFSNKTKLYITAVIFVAGTILFLAATLIIAFIALSLEGIKALVLEGNFDPAKFSLFLVITFILVSANYIRAITFSKRTYIGVHEKYQVVEAANRRDELVGA